MNILKNWIEDGEEWEFEDDHEELIDLLTPEQKIDTESEFYIITDDDDLVYFFVEREHDDDEEEMVESLRINYGCTTAYYWSVVQKGWCIL